MSQPSQAAVSDAFAAHEREQLRLWMGLSTRAKIEFFEEMVALAYHSGVLRPERLALRDAPPRGNRPRSTD